MLKLATVSRTILFALVAFAPRTMAQEISQIKSPEAGGTYTQIDVPGADFTVAAGINTAGDIVGYWGDGNRQHGFLLRDGVFTTLDVPNSPITIALGINDEGQIVGLSQSQGFLYELGAQTFTTVQFSSDTNTAPLAINNSGIIVGAISNGHDQVGFELNGTTYTTIKAPGATAYTALTAINNLGEALVAGSNGSIVSYYLLVDGRLNRLSNSARDEPLGINDLNAIVGAHGANIHVAGFVRKGDKRKLLRFPGSNFTVARGVNNTGVVVGSFYDAQEVSHGFMWIPPTDAAKK